MSTPIYIEFPITKQKFEAEKVIQPEFDLINITNVPSAQHGLQLLTQGWFKEIICSHQHLFGISFSINEKVNKKFNEKPNFLDFANKSSILIAFKSAFNEHESRTFWKVPGRENFYSTFVDSDADGVVISFLHELIIWLMKKEKSGKSWIIYTCLSKGSFA